MEIRLIVIRTDDLKRLVDFYTLLGLDFIYHKHGNSPFHYSTKIGQTTLEIYPMTKNQKEPDKTLRLGFAVDNFEDIVASLKDRDIALLSEPILTDFVFMTIISDPDGRKVEIYKK